MDSAINKYISILVSLLLSAIIFSTANAAGVCSPYSGFASLNEFFKDKPNQSNDVDDYAEIKILDSSIPLATYSQWTIQICENNGPGNSNDSDGCSGVISLGDFEDTVKPWLVLKDGTIGRYFNFKSGFDAILLDANDDVVDYISVDGYNALEESGCTGASLPYDYQFSAPGASDKFIFRTPDGTGDWDRETSAALPGTENGSNDTGSLPSLTFSDVIITQGTTAADVTFELDSGSFDIITINFATFDDTLIAGTDYTSVNTTGAFAIGDTSLTLTVPVSATSNLGDFKFFISINTSTAGLAQIINYVGTVSVVGGATTDHLSITHDGTAINCLAETITLSAHTSTAHGLDATYTGTVNLSTSSNSGDWSWVPGGSGSASRLTNNGNGSASYQFDGTEAGQVVLALFNPIQETITISADDGTTNNTSSGAVDASDNPPLVFNRAGFLFHEANGGAIGTQIAGKDSPTGTDAKRLQLEAWDTNQDTKACEAVLGTGIIAVDLTLDCVDPASCQREITIESTPLSNPFPPTAVGLDFNDQALADLILNYPDAGQIRLFAKYTRLDGLVIEGYSDTFVVVPAGLCVYSPDANSACSMPYADCDPAFRQAGADFSLRIKGVVWQSDAEENTDFCDNNTTPNFQVSGIGIAQDNLAPLDLDGGVAGVAGVTSFDLVAIDTGDHNISNQTSSEVGVFSYTATPTNLYFGETISASTSAEIGRFTPSAFDLINILDGSFDSVCKAAALPADFFTYIGQDFSYEINPTFTVRALNGLSTPLSPQVAVNYRSDFVKLSANNIVFSDITADSSNGLLVSYESVALPTPTYNNLNATDPADLVTVVYVFGNDKYRYGADVPTANPIKFANSELPPFVADIVPRITEVGDGEVSTILAVPQVFNTAGNNLRFGRIRMSNAFGSELIDLNMPMTIEYLTADGYYQKNDDDSCTTFNDADLLIIADNLTSPGASTPSVTSSPAVQGELGATLSAPGLDSMGNSITGTIDLSGFLGGVVISNPWLRYNWDNGTEFDDDPGATATFGIYKGNDVNIYIQQTYQ